MSKRVAVITGADQPLGAAVASEVASTVDAVVPGGVDADRLETLSDLLEPTVEQVTPLRTDVRDEFDIERLMETASRVGEGSIEYVVPCARVNHLDVTRPPDEWSYAAFDDEFRTNVRGVFTVVREAEPHCQASAVVAVPWVDADDGVARPAEVAIESLVQLLDTVAAPTCLPVAVDTIPLETGADASGMAETIVAALAAHD